MMRPVDFSWFLCAAAFCPAFSGCYSMYAPPYGGYPSPMYQGTPYQPQIQTLTPGQPYVPNGSYQSTIPQGTTTTPTYSQPGSTPPNSGLQPIPESNAPAYNPAPNSSPKAPDPYYKSTYQPPASTGLNSIQPAALAEPAPLNPPTSGLREVRSPAPTTADPFPSSAESGYSPVPARSPLPVTAAPVPEAEAFSLPRTAPAMPAAAPAKSVDPFAAPAKLEESAPAAAAPVWDLQTKKVDSVAYSPFGHDPKYKWLRGVVSKEPQDGSWSIVYDDEPDADDQWAGHLSLAPSPELDRLKDGDVVEIQGQIDQLVQDQLGKPVFLISELKTLSPRK